MNRRVVHLTPFPRLSPPPPHEKDAGARINHNCRDGRREYRVTNETRSKRARAAAAPNEISILIKIS